MHWGEALTEKLNCTTRLLAGCMKSTWNMGCVKGLGPAECTITCCLTLPEAVSAVGRGITCIMESSPQSSNTRVSTAHESVGEGGGDGSGDALCRGDGSRDGDTGGFFGDSSLEFAVTTVFTIGATAMLFFRARAMAVAGRLIVAALPSKRRCTTASCFLRVCRDNEFTSTQCRIISLVQRFK